MKYIYLIIAIILEVVGSSFLKLSEGFTKLIPTVVVLVAYSLCFYSFSLSLKEIPLGVGYATWSGLGIVLTTIVSVVVFKQKLDVPAIVGMILVVIGVVIINFVSKSGKG